LHAAMDRIARPKFEVRRGGAPGPLLGRASTEGQDALATIAKRPLSRPEVGWLRNSLIAMLKPDSTKRAHCLLGRMRVIEELMSEHFVGEGGMLGSPDCEHEPAIRLKR
jgi:hypothetical protein